MYEVEEQSGFATSEHLTGQTVSVVTTVCNIYCFNAYCSASYPIFPIHFNFLIFLTESVQRTSKETEANIGAVVALCLKYAPDRVGGGGRKNICTILE